MTTDKLACRTKGKKKQKENNPNKQTKKSKQNQKGGKKHDAVPGDVCDA